MNNIDSILKFDWLPMKEWHVLKAAHKAIYSHDWPRNLQLAHVRHARNLRSSSTINLVIPTPRTLFSIARQPSLILCHPMLNVVIILNLLVGNIMYFNGGPTGIGRNDFLPSFDNVCIYCIITFYCLLPSFLQIHN